MRVLFAGSPAIACPSFAALLRLHKETGLCEIGGLLTNPDAAKGRHGTPTPSALSAEASRLAAETGTDSIQFKFPSLGQEAMHAVQQAGGFDLLVSFAYGKIFPPEFLALFPAGGINIHPSLLPRYRGASPLREAILNGDRETGISIQRLSQAMDAGAILAQETFPLNGTETGGSLAAYTAGKAASMLCALLIDMKAGRITEKPQDESDATYCGKHVRADRQIDWAMSARTLDAKIRAYAPDMQCWTRHGGRDLAILEGSADSYTMEGVQKSPGAVLGTDKKRGILIQCGEGVFAARTLQYQTKKALDFRAFLNGTNNFIGTILG